MIVVKVIIQPNWSFNKALEEAWAAYHGGQEYGATNRIRVLENWGNVVGKERALTEFEAILSNYSNRQTASQALGLSEYAIRKLLKHFKSVPNSRSQVEPQSLHQLLQLLPELNFNNELDLVLFAAPRLGRLLGYSDSEMYFDLSLGGDAKYRADAAFSILGPNLPRIIFEFMREDSNQIGLGLEQVRHYKLVSNADYGVLLSVYHISIVSNDNLFQYELERLTSQQAKLVENFLRRPASSGLREPQTLYQSETSIEKLLRNVESAETNEDKKNSLELLARRVFESHSFLRCKYINLRTSSSEIDLVCEYLGHTKRTLFDEYGRYFLVECKNWSRPAGAKEVRDFLGKIEKSRVKLGILFSKNGITGEANGTDALREIHSCYDRSGICVVVLSLAELKEAGDQTNIIDLIDTKLDQLRFDM